MMETVLPLDPTPSRSMRCSSTKHPSQFELKLANNLKSRMNTGSPDFFVMLFSGGMA